MADKALLIGINQYRIPGADLRGCVNDIEQMRDVLRELYQFPASSIKTLVDYDATKSNIQSEVESVIRQASAGDRLFVHYSGHGSYFPDASGDESDDGRDEVICPTDLNWDDPLLDDWFRRLFDSTLQGVNLTVVMDCCHSGSNTREIRPPGSTDPIQRFLPPPLALRTAGARSRGTITERPVTRTIVRNADVRVVDIAEVHISGCRDDQTSADAYLDGGFHGALTYALVATMREAKGKLTYRELHDGATRRLDGRFQQAPQLEGRAANLDREVLSRP